MPTGYTSAVADGTITTLRDFGLRCARAFGACITMRDESIDTPPPPRFEPSPYHRVALNEAENRLIFLLNLTPQQRDEEAAKAFEAAEAANTHIIAERNVIKARYAAMLQQVNGWKCPANLADLQQFMRDQLLESIKYDTDTAKFESTAPERRPGAEWVDRQIKLARENIAYHTNQYAAEIARVDDRNRWLRLLYESLPQ